MKDREWKGKKIFEKEGEGCCEGKEWEGRREGREMIEEGRKGAREE